MIQDASKEIKLNSLSLVKFNKEDKEHLNYLKYILSGLEKRFSGILNNLMRDSNDIFDKGYFIKDNGKLIGYIDISAYNNSEESVYLRASVDGNNRGKGYSKLILNEISEYIFSNHNNVTCIKLKIASDNVKSIKCAISCNYLNIPGSEYYVRYNPYIDIKDKVKF